MNFSVNFPLILSIAVLVTGALSALDALCFAPRRRRMHRKPNAMMAQIRSFFPVLLLVLLIRSFLLQPYRVPTGSLEPTIMPGDFIVVSQYAYGLRLPVLHTKIWSVGAPKVGDIALFRWPKDPAILYVKRVVGTPGDRVSYKNKQLTINGKPAPQELLGMTYDKEPGAWDIKVEEKKENLNGTVHHILVQPGPQGLGGDFSLVVPEGQYFMMGDNRDNSYDSRFWGFVPEKNLVGKALVIWMSWDADRYRVRWPRLGTLIH